MRLLLLGGSGFLGRHVERAAIGLPEVELVTHRGRRSVRDSGRGSRSSRGSSSVALDLLGAPESSLRELLEAARPDVVVNATGATLGDRALLEALNVHLVARLLAAIAAAAPDARLVQLGSAAELGRTPVGDPIDETTPAAPQSEYGRTKLAGTRLVLTALQGGRRQGVVLRIFNPVGAGMSEATLPGRAAREIRHALANDARSIRLGPLDDHRDFVDARDVAGAVLLAATGRATSPMLNVGSGVAVRARELVETLATIAGFAGEIEEEEHGSERSPAVPWQQADIGRIRTELGWVPRRTLRQALEALWAG